MLSVYCATHAQTPVNITMCATQKAKVSDESLTIAFALKNNLPVFFEVLLLNIHHKQPNISTALKKWPPGL